MTSADTQPYAEAARRAAARLSPEFGPKVSAEAERALASEGRPRPPDQYEMVAVAIGSLIVSIANLAWTVYKDSRKLQEERATSSPAATATPRMPVAEALERQVRLNVEVPRGVSPEQRDRIIAAVVAEVLQA